MDGRSSDQRHSLISPVFTIFSEPFLLKNSPAQQMHLLYSVLLRSSKRIPGFCFCSISFYKRYRKAASCLRLTINCYHTSMKVNDFPGHRKAQAVSLCFMAAITLIKLLENMTAGFRTHTTAMIGHRNHNIPRFVSQYYPNHTELRTELCSVVQQIQPDLFQQCLTAVVHTRGILMDGGVIASGVSGWSR